MKYIYIILFFYTLNLSASLNFDEIKVYKSKHKMDLLLNGTLVKSYRVMLGSGGLAPKRQEGDKLVPEGQYVLDELNPNSKYHRSIHISYPNEEDIERAKEAGVDPGGSVFIHGVPNSKSKIVEWLLNSLVKIKDHTRSKKIEHMLDWTKGCIAVSNKEAEEIFDNISTPTPITIYP